jgi:hypothetical protein
MAQLVSVRYGVRNNNEFSKLKTQPSIVGMINIPRPLDSHIAKIKHPATR